MTFRKTHDKGDEEQPDAVATSRKLRDQALSVTAWDLNLEPIAARPDVWGVLMELGYPQAVATLAAFADGSTSLYVSTGGGVIGAGERKAVREEADRFLTVVQQHIEGFEPTDETPLPSAGRVRFYVRTFQSTLTAEVEDAPLARGTHKLSPVFQAGHAVITQMRLLSEHDRLRP
jgi:hypothetical protein